MKHMSVFNQTAIIPTTPKKPPLRTYFKTIMGQNELPPGHLSEKQTTWMQLAEERPCKNYH